MIFSTAPVIVIAGALLGCAGESDMTVASVRTDLEANLPLGSPPERVIAYVNDRGYTSDGPLSADSLNPTIKDKNVFEMRSIIRNTRNRVLVKYSIAITFTFDSDRRLTAIAVEEVGTGL